MAGQAERDFGLYEKVLFIRAMGAMTSAAAAFLKNSMDHFPGVRFLLVAEKAELAALCLKEIARLGRMWIVAGGAFAGL